MNKLKAFIHLDFVTVKPYLGVKYLLLYASSALFLTTTSANLQSGLTVGLMLSTLFIGYPFALAENHHLDALYTTLAIEKKTVVLGRYLFIFLFDICAVLFSLVLAAVVLASTNPGFSLKVDDAALTPILALSTLFLIVQAIQLCLYFKFGYAKARMMAIAPFIAIMAGGLAINSMSNVPDGLSRLLVRVTEDRLAIPLVAAFLLAVMMISYSLSLTFYQKREF